MEAMGLLGQVSSLGSLCPSRPALGLKDLPLGVRVVISGPADPHTLINLSQPRSALPVQGSLEPVPGNWATGSPPSLHSFDGYQPTVVFWGIKCANVELLGPHLTRSSLQVSGAQGVPEWHFQFCPILQDRI